ncbi:MAG: diaminopimelate epimerase [Steroidobacteraceae bacterium]
MRHEFIKMHGLGNDFIVLDANARDGLTFTRAQWRALSDRHRGIGFDQALVLEPPRDDEALAFYRIYNADGLEVEQCGNGVRCLAELLRLRGKARNGQLLLDSPAGPIHARLGEPGIVSVDMGEPDFTPAAVAFDTAGQPGPLYAIDVQNRHVEFSIASMGNPHAVIEVPDTATAPVGTLGAALESHPRFMRRVNVGFRQIRNANHVRLRVYERGVGETQACGTGACAAVATGIRDGLLGNRVQVDLPGGTLFVSWEGIGKRLWLEGPAEVSFTGQFDI